MYQHTSKKIVSLFTNLQALRTAFLLGVDIYKFTC